MDVIKKKKVSFSQYAKYLKCPKQYELDYIKGLRTFDGNLNTSFGTAIHFALQTYIEKLYKESEEISDSLDLNKLFKEKFDEELLKLKTQNLKYEYTNEEYCEFILNSEDILKAFLKTSTRIKHFPTNKYEFIGTELPLDASLRNNVEFIAYVDLILKEKITGKIKIIDFKTSTSGWNKWMTSDPLKYEQVLLYKAFYSKKFNVPINMIEVEFFILKRKLYENVGYPQSHIQLFTPPHNSSAIAETLNNFSEFIKDCFNEDGTYNINGKYPKIPGKAKKNCKYCTHHKTINCDGKADKLED
jgi:hypothetical protein